MPNANFRFLAFHDTINVHNENIKPTIAPLEPVRKTDTNNDRTTIYGNILPFRREEKRIRYNNDTPNTIQTPPLVVCIEKMDWHLLIPYLISVIL